MAESMDKQEMAPTMGDPAMGEDPMMAEAPTMGEPTMGEPTMGEDPMMAEAPTMGEPAMEENPTMGEASGEGKHESLLERVEHLIHHDHKE